MDNEQLLDRVQGLLLGMEERVVAQFKTVESRLGNVLSAQLHGVQQRLGKLERNPR